MSKDKYIVCERCERVFEKTADGIFVEGKAYVCDHCRMSAADPRRMKPQHVKVVQPWMPTPDEQKCEECGETIWFIVMKLMVARELVTPHDIIIKGAMGDDLQLFDCPNPDCPRSWNTPTFQRSVPTFLRPPWDRPAPGLSSEFDAMSDDDKNKAAEIFHRIWWEQWKKHASKMKEAGKGVDLMKQTGGPIYTAPPIDPDME